MDSVFLLSEEDRARFLQNLVQAFGCTYVCLWSYYPHRSTSCFLSMDGYYNDNTNQPSSSSGSLAQKLFNEYRESLILPSVENNRIPGLAFKRSLPYIEFNELELLTQSSLKSQQQFYQEAKIKTAAFMGCKSGEIELGMSKLSQINMEMEMWKWFPEDFSQESPFRELPAPPPPDHNRPSSSSSSLRSLSMDSPEYSSLLLNMPISTSHIPESLKKAVFEQATKPITSSAIMPHQQSMQPYNLLPNIQFPTSERDDAAITLAMLAVISSPSSSSSSYQSRKESAFKNYSPTLAPRVQIRPDSRRSNMLNRAITLFRNINLMRTQEQMQLPRPTSTQLHHMISERKRREKLNESFQALRALLPPGSKRDKASVLSSTRDYLSALKAQVFELNQKNRLLEARLPPTISRENNEELGGDSSNAAGLNIQLLQSSESISEEREIELRVTVRENGNMMDLILRVLEFLKEKREMISLVSMEADSQLQQSSSSINHIITLRLKIKGTEWDETAFREAMTGVIADVAQ